MLRALRNNDSYLANLLKDEVKTIRLLHSSSRSHETAKKEVACSVWSGQALADIYSECISIVWKNREHDNGEWKTLPSRE